MSLSGCLMTVLLMPSLASGAVRIVDDEVIFSVRAPDAKDVFLVGDFNNWNPTLEKMDKRDGYFEVYLFLLPGTYRYKFVIDGNWAADADNPPAVESQGSLLVLEERGGMLTFGAVEEAPADGNDVLLEPSLRYDGAFFVDDRQTDSYQVFDVFFRHSGKSVNAMVDFRTTDDTWSLSPLSAQINFDRGHVDLSLGGAMLKAFENDTIWTSSDPFTLVGRLGVFDYNAGYERQGFAFDMPLPLNIKLKTFYSDKIDSTSGPPLRIGADELDDASPDRTVYAYEGSVQDEDTWGIEFFVDAGSFKLGYVKRGNRGFHPGLVAEVVESNSQHAVVSATTKEFWDADVAWLRWRFIERVAAVVGYGWGTGEIRTNAGWVSLTPDLGDVTVGQVSTTVDEVLPIQTSERWRGAIEYEANNLHGAARYEWSRFEFEQGVYTPSTAKINVADIDASYHAKRWRTTCNLRYIDQDYGETPDDFHYFTPARNIWLDHRDRLTIDNMVAFDLERSTQITASFSWNDRVLSRLARVPTEAPTALEVMGGVTTNGFFKRIEYGYLRLGIEHTFPRRFFALWDSRLAGYNKPSWGFEDTFFSTYLEAGYRTGHAEISLGFGLDPVVLDPVQNEFDDIGREKYLRTAIPDGLGRDQSVLLGERLRGREESLEDNSVLKLELILIF